MLISLLIPYTKDRIPVLKDLLNELYRQINGNPDIEILKDDREQPVSIGTKRNSLLERATGKYLAFIDSDDMVSEDYIKILLDGIASDPDCISLMGIMTTNGNSPEVFEHSIKYNAYKTNEGAKFPEVKFERFPNHVSCIRSSIAKQFKFPEINHGEDTDFATQVFNSGLIKTEYYHEKILYHYIYKTNK